ncbi:unnamed protein product [Eruca vesicaria subsp. sativa]|uniref:Uncharacterized protein n=1 Tax=Eruca vesicaria subsp. sativa TaxID=29727 RepID=A0ABC8JTB6_ERUVS|nr:unnamed protein product [Eruca vesicaria subsp. sativa]
MVEAQDGFEVTAQSNQVGDVLKTLKKMMTVIKRVEKKVDQLGGRLEPLEAFVKEAKKHKTRKKRRSGFKCESQVSWRTDTS